MWGFIPVAFTPIQSSLLFLVYNCFYGKHLRIKKIYPKLYRGKTFHQCGCGEQVIEHTYLTGTYPCPRNEEHYPPPCCVCFLSHKMCVFYRPCIPCCFLFWGQGLKNIIIGFCSHTFFLLRTCY